MNKTSVSTNTGSQQESDRIEPLLSHLRTVHFSILIGSAVLFASIGLGESKLDKAYSQISTVRLIVDDWNNAIYAYSMAQFRDNRTRLKNWPPKNTPIGANVTIPRYNTTINFDLPPVHWFLTTWRPLPQDPSDLTRTDCADCGYRSQKLSVGFSAAVDGKSMESIRKPEALSEFIEDWNLLQDQHYIVFVRDWSNNADTLVKISDKGSAKSWEKRTESVGYIYFGQKYRRIGRGLLIQRPPEPIQDAIEVTIAGAERHGESEWAVLFDKVKTSYVDIQPAGTCYPAQMYLAPGREPDFAFCDTRYLNSWYSDKFGFAIPIQSAYFPVPSFPSYITTKLNLSLNSGPFEKAFGDLNDISKDFSDLEIQKIENIIASLRSSRTKDIEIMGGKITTDDFSSWGILALVCLQIYFLVHIREYCSLIQLGHKGWSPWIGVYEGMFPRVLFLVTALLLPITAEAVALLYSLEETAFFTRRGLWLALLLTLGIAAATFTFVVWKQCRTSCQPMRNME